MKKIGLSIYPDFNDREAMQNQLDIAKELGYTIVFTSMELGDLGFENTSVGLNDNFMFLFTYCYEIGMEIHADINKNLLTFLHASPNDLSPIAELHIQVLRLDDGFCDEEVAVMTRNTFGIYIEENASMLQFPKRRIETVCKLGNVSQYCACHNFFPLNETGLRYEDALASARLFKSYHVKVGIFIGSLYSSKELNAIGRGVLTIENQRYLPSHVQAMEIFAQDDYDYVIFGDSNPSYEELKRVSEVAKNDSLEFIQSKYKTDYIDEELDGMYCIELPVWLDKNLDEKLKKELTSMVFVARGDQPTHLLRATQSRGIAHIKVYNPMERVNLVITINNCLSNRYMGELQITLKDLPSVEYVNVIGQVKPYAKHLLEKMKYGKAAFVLKEE